MMRRIDLGVHQDVRQVFSQLRRLQRSRIKSIPLSARPEANLRDGGAFLCRVLLPLSGKTLESRIAHQFAGPRKVMEGKGHEDWSAAAPAARAKGNVAK